MCGRYLIDETDEVFQNLPGKKGEICPGDHACVYVKENRITPVLKTWGFKYTGSSRLLINARSETAASKPTFAQLMKSSRILVPASAYYEFDPKKRKHLLGIAGRRIYMAGLFEGDRFVILTASAAPAVKSIHDRMPVIFNHDLALSWLNNNCDPIGLLNNALPAEIFE